MRLTFHPSVAADTFKIISHYEKLGGPNLAREFHAELLATFLKAQTAPRKYQIQERGLRRVNLPRFPYHFLFRIDGEDNLRVLVVRHHSRRPSLGTSRRW